MENKNYVLESVKQARIEVLGLGEKINQILKENGYSTVADLFLELYDELFPEEVLRKIKFERDSFVERIKDFSNATIDPENCIYGTLYQYYNILLLLEKDMEIDNKIPKEAKIKIKDLSTKSFSVENLNHILATATRMNVSMLHMKATDKMSYKDIGEICRMNATQCRVCIKLLVEKIKLCVGEIFIFDEAVEVLENEQNEVVFIDFLGLDTRCVNALKMKKINTLAELKQVAKAGELINIRNIGKKGYNEIIKVLENYS